MKLVHITSITICGPVNLPVRKPEWKSSVVKILSTSSSPSEIYSQINLPVEIWTTSNLGPLTILLCHLQRIGGINLFVHCLSLR